MVMHFAHCREQKGRKSEKNAFIHKSVFWLKQVYDIFGFIGEVLCELSKTIYKLFMLK